MELRCTSGIKHGDLIIEEGVLEVKCRSKRCGHRSGIVVLHQFSVITGQLLSTRKFIDPVRRERNANVRSSSGISVASEAH